MKNASDSLDLDARQQMAGTIRDFLNDRLTAFEFDEKTGKIASATKDSTIRLVADIAWSFYDDCKDHRVALEKREWDIIQRLLLVLESDARIVDERRWGPWSLRQLIACLGFFGFVAAFTMLGWSAKLLWLNIPLVLLSTSLWKWWPVAEEQISCDHLALVPFDSRSAIKRCLKKARGFRKQKFRVEIGRRSIRSDVELGVLRSTNLVSWWLAAPLVLLFQAMPPMKVRYHLIDAK